MSPNDPVWVMANGCFDGLHIGHIMHLSEAAKWGDRLVIALTSDKFVNKGPGRPYFNAHERYKHLMELKCVDHVIVVNDVLDAMAEITPDIFVKGAEYIDKIEPRHEVYFVEHKIELRFTNTKKFSSTTLLRDRLR